MFPSFLQKYFWDIPFETLRPQQYPAFVIARLLEYGDSKALDWMREQFSERAIRRVLCTSRQLSKRSANYWKLIFGLDTKDILSIRAISSTISRL